MDGGIVVDGGICEKLKDDTVQIRRIVRLDTLHHAAHTYASHAPHPDKTMATCPKSPLHLNRNVRPRHIPYIFRPRRISIKHCRFLRFAQRLDADLF